MIQKKLVQVQVESVRQRAQDTFLLRFHEEELAKFSRAGHFVEVKIPQTAGVLWRRPFSIHNTNPDTGGVELLFHIIGRGSAALAAVEPGTVLDVLGPLGNSFEIEPDLERALVVAGGLGIAPFKLLQRELAARHVPITLFYGAANRSHMCDLDFWDQHTELFASTDDGSYGYRGFVTDLFADYLKTHLQREQSCVYVCGPTPMMQKVQKIVESYGLSAQVTLETMMACGFGACVGCAVPMARPQKGVKEYFLACKDGPVFNMKDIIIDE